MWETEGSSASRRFVKTELREQLRSEFIRDWKTGMSRSSKCSLYKDHKKNSQDHV